MLMVENKCKRSEEACTVGAASSEFKMSLKGVSGTETLHTLLQ